MRTLPVTPPIDPMLARLEDHIPRGDGWVYEPKWDGFRAIVFVDGDDVHIDSRDHKPLQRYFPELVPAARAALPARCVLDGEIVVAGTDGLEFDALLQRIHPARSRIELLARTTPASFVFFDALALGQEDLREEPLVRRRERLEQVLGSAGKPQAPAASSTQVLVTPQTHDADEAASWIEALEPIGLDGIVAKRLDSPYVAGERVMVKVKRERTADCVVGGYRLSKSGDGVGSLLLGLYDGNGVLHYVGHTSSFRVRERKEVLERLRPLEGGTSFVGGRAPGGPSRWSAGRETTWISLDPELVCEVAFDRLLGDRFRHASRFVRWRDDRDPKSCTFEQLGRTAR